jgi:predicted molibdopterin-dependent oxidoreductase YjgC
MREVLTTCVYCGCGCGVYLREEGGRVVGAFPSRNHPVSRGNLCVKGWHLHEFIHDPARLTAPLLRKNGTLAPVSWEEALDYAAGELRRLKEQHGPDALGVLASAKCTNEENYLLQKFTRAVLGTNNIDHCARL